MYLSQIFFCAVLSLLFSTSAYAYLDPATGSYVVQVIIGVVVSSLYVLKMYWRRIKGFFSIRSEKSTSESAGKNK